MRWTRKRASSHIVRWVSLAACVVLAGCERREIADGDGPTRALSPMPRPGAEEPRRARELVVFAPASLRDVFTELRAEFARSHPDVELVFHFSGTQALRTQLEHGAVADVFASADRRFVDELVGAELVVDPVVFARNPLVLVVADESAARIRDFTDLPHADRIVVGAPEVPIGRYTLEVFDRATRVHGAEFRAQIEARIVSRELNVRQVLAKVKMGEADAGIVYRGDLYASPKGAHVVMLPAELEVIAEYPIAVVVDTKRPEFARSWVNFVLSQEGRRVLQEHGFLAPTGSDSEP